MSSAVIGKALSAFVVAGALLVIPAQSARAEDPARAEQLFQEGRRLFDQKKMDLACDKLAASQRLRAAVNTVGLLAACYEEQGMFAAAAKGYREAMRLAGPGDPRANFAEKKLNELRSKIGTVSVRLAAPEDGVTIEIGGDTITGADLADDILVAPGTTVVVARAPNREEWRHTLEIQAGERKEIEIPPLRPFASRELPPASGQGTLRVAGFVVGGLGVLGLGLGTGFGIAAIGKTKDSNAPGRCDEQNHCTPEGGALRDDARSLALVSSVGFGAGIALAGAGVVMILVGGGDSSKETGIGIMPYAGPGGAGLSLAGKFTAF